LRVTDVQEGRRAVRVRVDELFGPDAPDVCPEVAAERCLVLALGRPLGTRRVVDLPRGRTARRVRPDEVRARCERAREGGRLPPSRLGRP
jgi:hypothetical protein